MILKTKKIRLFELSILIDSTQPKDCSTIKEIRLVNDISIFLLNNCKEFANKTEDLEIKKKPIIDKFTNIYKSKTEGHRNNDYEKKVILDKINGELSVEYNKILKKEILEINNLGMEDIEIEIEEKYLDKIKEIFNNKANLFYKDKKVLLEVADSLGI